MNIIYWKKGPSWHTAQKLGHDVSPKGLQPIIALKEHVFDNVFDNVFDLNIFYSSQDMIKDGVQQKAMFSLLQCI